MPRNYRKNSPPSSARAGQAIETSGVARTHRQLCLDEVIATPGVTAREIQNRLGVKAHRRLPELRADGMVANGRDRNCSITGRLVMTWYPTRARRKGARR